MTPQQFFALSLGFAAAALATQPARAQGAQQCAERAAVVTALAETYGESRRAIGLAANNAVMEVFASDASGTWTITVTLPSGLTCLVASGSAYEALADALPRPGDDA